MLRVTDHRGDQTTMHDPYAFPPLLTEYDLYLLGEGKHWHAYNKLGAQLRDGERRRWRELRGVGAERTRRRVCWAISTAGTARRHPMRKHIPGGVWELFVPGLGEGTIYKYRVKNPCGEEIDKSDPIGFGAEVPPRTASKVYDLSRYQWHDEAYMLNRPSFQALDKPINIYEVHLGSWRRPGDDPHRWLTYRDTCPSAGGILRRDGLHAHRAVAGQRASLYGKLGLPDGRLLCRDQPLWLRPRTSCTSSITATSTASAC